MSNAAKEFQKLINIVRILRSKKGCKWDRAQKLFNLKTYLLEETYELLDAINDKNPQRVKEELGDVFLLLIFIIQLFKENNRFTAGGVLREINAKLVSRHPHVFSSKKIKNKNDIVKYWVETKSKSKRRKTLADRLPKAAPSLLLAYIFFKEISYLGYRLDPELAIREIKKSLKEFDPSKVKKRNIYKLILDFLKLAAHYKVDLEVALREGILKEAKKLKY